MTFFSFIWGFMSLSTLQGNITTGSFVGGGNQYIHLVKVLYCKLPTIGKQLPTFLHQVQGSRGDNMPEIL